MKITTIGNCQARRLGEYISAHFPNSEVTFLSPTDRVQEVASKEESERSIKSADVIIRQPLGPDHGILSSKATSSIARPGAAIVNFAYFFNSGYASMCYGNEKLTHGEEDIIRLHSVGATLQDLQEMWSRNEIDFRIKQRFDECLAQMKTREQICQVKVADYVSDNYTTTKLFDTHNHPTKVIFLQYLRQLIRLGILDGQVKIDEDQMEETNLPRPFCPTCPSDHAAMGYKYENDPDWDAKGRHVIGLIFKRLSANAVNQSL